MVYILTAPAQRIGADYTGIFNVFSTLHAAQLAQKKYISLGAKDLEINTENN